MEDYKGDKHYDVKQKKPFNHTGLGIIVWLIFFFPAGLYFMFKNEVWSVKARAIICLFLLFPVGIYMLWKHDIFNIVIRVVVTSFYPLYFVFLYLNASNEVCTCQRYFVEMQNNLQTGGSNSFSLQDLTDCQMRFGKGTTWANQCSSLGGKPARF
tara:strand:+ start:5151 stop:5615 length:465 start_codon:yes stop_codon:yes gene_type:complete